MDTQTRILILEDNESDAVMVGRALRKITDLEVVSRWAQDKPAYVQALNEFVPDLILADYSLPNFDGLAAMAMARQLFAHIPVIIVSGAIGEEVAIEALKAGATDYVLKDRLGRLGPVICRALVESHQLQEKIGYEDALRRSEERFRTTFENAAVGIEQVALDGRLLEVNPALCAMLGYTREELLARTFNEITHPEDRPGELTILEQLLRGEIPSYQIEKRCLTRQGRPVWVRVTSSLAQGSRSYRVSIIEDITARKEAETALRLSEERFRSFMSHSPLASWIVDRKGEFHYVNPGYYRMFDVREVELVGKTIGEVYDRALAEKYLATNLVALDEQRVVETVTTGLRPDGSEGEFLVVKFPIQSASGETLLGGMALDITERKQAEEAVRQARDAHARTSAQQEAVLRSMTEGLVIFDPDGNLLDMNPAALAMHGFESVDSMRVRLGELARLFELRDLAGELLPLEQWPIARVLRGEMFSRYEVRVSRTDGSRQWIASYGGTPVRDGEGRIMLGVITLRDVTDLREAEQRLRQSEQTLRVTNEKLIEADRRKDEFLAMLAHELRNPLAPIRYAVQMLNITGTQQPHMQRQRDVIDRQVSHMGRLLDDLLEVSRITRGKIQLRKERLDLRIMIEQVLDGMRELARERHLQLWYQAPSAPLVVEGDPTRLEQILRNLLANATKYTEAGGCIWLLAEVAQAGGQAWYAMLTVRDSGIGIAPEVLPRIFDLFAQADQTLDRAQGGLGIGLTMVKRLVELHGGTIEARSEGLGRGSEFIVRLPLAETVTLRMPENLEPEHATAEEAPAPMRRVLVVDDNEDSAASLGELLGLWGHEVRTAHDGLRALAAAHEWRPEVILLDIGLPGMDGYEVARRLRREPETAHVWMVALTGYGTEEDRRRALEAGFNHHLVKPVCLDQLNEMLARSAA